MLTESKVFWEFNLDEHHEGATISPYFHIRDMGSFVNAGDKNDLKAYYFVVHRCDAKFGSPLFCKHKAIWMEVQRLRHGVPGR